jgi:hypothetical protein
MRSPRDPWFEFLKINKKPDVLAADAAGSLADRAWKAWCTKYEQQFLMHGMPYNPLDKRLLVWSIDAFAKHTAIQASVREAVIVQESLLSWGEFKAFVQNKIQPEEIRGPALYKKWLDTRQKSNQRIS